MTDHTFQPVADDDGPDAIRVGAADGRVVIQLSQPMQWFGMTPEQAAGIAIAMTRYAVQIDPEIQGKLERGELASDDGFESVH